MGEVTTVEDLPDEILKIANNSTRDYKKKTGADGKVTWVVDRQHPLPPQDWSFWVMTEVEKPALAVLLHRFFLPEDLWRTRRISTNSECNAARLRSFGQECDVV
jgi:hypothetical protein